MSLKWERKDKLFVLKRRWSETQSILVQVFPGLTWTSHGSLNSSVLKFGHSSGLSWVWSGKKKKKKTQQLLLGVNGVHSTSSHSFEERGYENTNVIIMRDFNTFIKIKTGIYEFLLRAFKLKASLSYLKCCIGNNCWSFSLVRHLYTVTITTIFFFLLANTHN